MNLTPSLISAPSPSARGPGLWRHMQLSDGVRAEDVELRPGDAGGRRGRRGHPERLREPGGSPRRLGVAVFDSTGRLVSAEAVSISYFLEDRSTVRTATEWIPSTLVGGERVSEDSPG